MKCDGFLVSTWRTTILLRCLGEQQSPRQPLFGCRRPFCKKRWHCKWHLTNKRCMKKLENRHIQTASHWPLKYKGMQWGEGRAVLWLYRFHTPHRSCATASGEEELEEEKDELWKMSWTFSTFWRVFAWKNGYHCLLYNAHFRFDSSIRPVTYHFLECKRWFSCCLILVV